MCKIAQFMTAYQKRKIEQDFLVFARSNFEKPSECRNLEQIQFYIQEIGDYMEDMKNTYNYIPDSVYSLLKQYHTLQNKMAFEAFINYY